MKLSGPQIANEITFKDMLPGHYFYGSLHCHLDYSWNFRQWLPQFQEKEPKVSSC